MLSSASRKDVCSIARKKSLITAIVTCILILFTSILVDARAGPELIDWFSDEGQRIFEKQDGAWPRDGRALIIDVETGIRYWVVRNGGKNHADVEPESKADTEKLREIYGGAWNWDRRPVVVVINVEGEDRYFAASINGMPHGGHRRDVGFGGHSCVHFWKSKLHCAEAEDKKHQAAVMVAVEADLDEVFGRDANVLTDDTAE